MSYKDDTTLKTLLKNLLTKGNTLKTFVKKNK